MVGVGGWREHWYLHGENSQSLKWNEPEIHSGRLCCFITWCVRNTGVELTHPHIQCNIEKVFEYSSSMVQVSATKRQIDSPGWCGSVEWVLACQLEGCWFDYQSGHTPGLWARSLVGIVWEATTYWYFSPSLSSSLPLSLKINKENL